MVLFEVPTGIVADTVGRRASYLLGTVTLAVSTLFYVLLWELEAAFWLWAIASLLLGLGFTFFSGAVEAWLVDALDATGFTGELETVFGRGQVVSGTAMLTGSVAGGFIAQQTSLGVPFVLRGAVLVVMFAVAFALMRDVGFTPHRGGRPIEEMRKIASASIEYGWRVPAGQVADGAGAVHRRRRRLRLLRAPALPARALRRSRGVPDRRPGGGDRGRRTDPRRHLGAADPAEVPAATSALIAAAALSSLALLLIGLIESFWVVIGLIVVWGLLFAATTPIRQAYMNGLIPSQQRATILSFDSLVASSGGVWVQPVLGRAADVWGYAPSYLIGAGISALALPFLALSRAQNAPADSAVEGAR